MEYRIVEAAIVLQNPCRTPHQRRGQCATSRHGTPCLNKHRNGIDLIGQPQTYGPLIRKRSQTLSLEPFGTLSQSNTSVYLREQGNFADQIMYLSLSRDKGIKPHKTKAGAPRAEIVNLNNTIYGIFYHR